MTNQENKVVETEDEVVTVSPQKKWLSRGIQILFYLAAIGILVGMLYSPQNKLKNKTAPLFETVDYRGKPVSLGDLRGKVVVLDFWGVWCPHCVRMIPKLHNIKERYKKRGVVVIGLHSADGRPDQNEMHQYAQKHKINYPIWMGKKSIERDYMISTWPTMIIIDRKGMIRDIFRGAQGERKIRKVLNEILSE